MESKRVGNARASVLIVEDDPTILEILTEGLGDEGYRATGATALGEAIAALRAGRYDLVLSDAFRPTAVDAPVEQWRPLESLRDAAGDTPIIIVTAHRLDDYADYRARGFAAVLAKPFDLDRLFETVRGVLA